MLYLKSFTLPSPGDEVDFFNPLAKSGTFKSKNYRTCYQSKYPFGLFRDRQMPVFEFKEITILCGNNGSGKSTVLNLIAEKLCLERGAVYNRSDFFDDYKELCFAESYGKLPAASKIITSDDVFEKVIEIRKLNEGIDSRRDELLRKYIEDRQNTDPEYHRLKNLDDYDRWKEIVDANSKNTSQYLRQRLMRNVEERSNGESALAFFVDSINDAGLYLLDEPENSLSPSNQLQLKYFLEDCIRTYNCQFVISTHSPFLLSLRSARVYDIDSVPAAVRKWTELECVRVYADFFKENADKF